MKAQLNGFLFQSNVYLAKSENPALRPFVSHQANISMMADKRRQDKVTPWLEFSDFATYVRDCTQANNYVCLYCMYKP